MVRPLLLLFIFLIHCFYSDGQPASVKALDKLLSTEFKPREPGIAVLIARRGNIVYEKAFGSANIELDLPMQPDMVFRIGSITKQFTAVGILQLVEQGKLSLQDSIQQYIKDFPTKGYTITIAHLLTHTSGLKDYMSIDHPGPYVDRWDFKPDFLIDHFKQAPLDFAPGTKYAYTNSGYLLLAHIIEAASGQNYHDYMRAHVIKAAGLSHTLYADEREIIPGRVAGYTRDRGFYENAEYQSLSIGYGCGDLLSTVEDLYQWHKALLSYKLLKKETLEKAFIPYILNNGTSTEYGYGWFINKVHDSRCIHHEGQVSGFIAQELYFPEEDTYVALMTNLKSGEDQTDFSNRRFELFYQISRLALGREVSPEMRIDEASLSAYEGTYCLDSANLSSYNYIKKEKDHLIIEIPPKLRFDLTPITKDQFSIKGIRQEAILSFVRDEQGNVTGLSSLQKGTFDYMKISGPDNNYPGKYQSGPQFHEVRDDKGHLSLSSNTGLQELELVPVEDDKFLAKGSGLELPVAFIRDKKGRVVKITIMQTRPVSLIRLR